MRWRDTLYVVGNLTLFFAVMMIFPIAVSLIYKDDSLISFIQSFVITISVGLALNRICRGNIAEVISQREGMAIVSIGWISISLFGALPFYFDSHFSTFVDAFFESVSGFTTTGSSILVNIEVVSKSLLFWRSFIQWMGGMGIIVLSIAILPFLGVGGMQLYKAEVPSPVPDKLKPRIRDTAMVLWKVYLLMTLAQIFLLILGGMTLFDATCHTFTTMPTGGFSPKNASIAHYNSLFIDMVIILFMLLAGINFSLHYKFLKGESLAFWKDSECRFFIGLVGILILVVSVNIYGSVYDSAGRALRYGAFQVASIITTRGYVTADWEKWPAMSQLILILCMFLGACAGSTGGGVKTIRVMLYLKYCYKELFYLIHPKSVSHVKIGGKVIPEDIIRSVLGFLGLYIALFAVCTVLLSSMGVDFITSISAVATTLGNTGPGLGLVGPTDNFSQIPYLGKWLLIWCMLLGRLEIYTMIIFLVPEFWRK
ncbi:MAG: TrkH family potassium uptake protein [Thermodesulfobacteriota bacterium]